VYLPGYVYGLRLVYHVPAFHTGTDTFLSALCSHGVGNSAVALRVCAYRQRDLRISSISNVLHAGGCVTCSRPSTWC